MADMTDRERALIDGVAQDERNEARRTSTIARDDLRELAQESAESIAARFIEPGMRVVVAVTTEDGAWIGVGTNTSRKDTETVLTAALHGGDRQYRRESCPIAHHATDCDCGGAGGSR